MLVSLTFVLTGPSSSFGMLAKWIRWLRCVRRRALALLVLTRLVFSQRLRFDPFRIAGCVARCATHLAPSPIVSGAFDIVSAAPIVLNASHRLLVTLWASWPYISTWRVRIAVAVAPVAMATLAIVFDVVCIDSTPPTALDGSRPVLLHSMASRSVSRHDTFVASSRRFLSSSGLPWWSWCSPGAAVSPPGSSGPSGACLCKFSSPLRSNRFLMRSDAFGNFLDRSLALSSRLGAPDVSASPLVHASSKLATDFFSPSSLTLRGSLGWLAHSAGLPGGGGGPGNGSGTSSLSEVG